MPEYERIEEEHATVFKAKRPPELNVPLLRKTMEHIEHHPEHWYQGSWRTNITPDTAGRMSRSPRRQMPMDCGTAMCFAGWACELNGDDWAPDQREATGHLYVSDHVVVDGKRQPASDRAQELLGLSDFQAEMLFEGVNRLKDLQEIVADLIEEAEG